MDKVTRWILTILGIISAFFWGNYFQLMQNRETVLIIAALTSLAIAFGWFCWKRGKTAK